MWFIFAILTSVLAASNSILQKRTLKDLHAVQLMTITSSILASFSFFLIPFFGLGITFFQLILILIYGSTVALATIFTIKAMRHLDVSIIAPFFNIGTLFTAILALIIFNEKITLLGLIGILIIVSGGYILELKSKNPIQPFIDIIKSTSMHYLIGGVFLFSLSFLLAKITLNFINPIGLFAYQEIICFLIFSFITFKFYKGKEDVLSGIKKGRLFIPILALFIFLENILLLEALRIGEVSIVIPIYRTWTLWAVILGGQIFHEKYLIKRVFSSLLMIVGVTLILL